ncbi:hypothetical protein J6A31_07350 [bacterium]|nr:hypothetical protein [bacterium]
MANDVKLSDVYALYTDKQKFDRENGLTLGDVLSSSAKAMFKPITTLSDKLADKVSNVVVDLSDSYDDNIMIPVGTKTLIGADFTSLYPMWSEKEYPTTDGMTMRAIHVDQSKAPYFTEMLDSNLKRWNCSSYDIIDINTKASYEIALLTKKFTYQYDNADAAQREALSSQYAADIGMYRNYCEVNNLSWSSVLSDVSAEFQKESCVFKEDVDGSILDCARPEANRVLSNKAHTLLKTCLGDEYVDELRPYLMDKISYEETFDANERDVGIFTQLKAKIVDWWTNFKENRITLSGTINSVTSKIKNGITSYIGAVESKMDTLDGKTDDSCAFVESTVAENSVRGYEFDDTLATNNGSESAGYDVD